MTSLDVRPLAWGLGAGLGVMTAVALGAYGLGWGATLAFPAALLLLSVGVYFERGGGNQLAHLLRLGLGFTVGYLACAVPLTWLGLQSAIERLAATDPAGAVAFGTSQGRQLIARWATVFLAIPGAAGTLWLIRKRADAAPK